MSFLSTIQKIFGPRGRVIGATDLKRALTHDEFVFYYQPEWDLRTRKVKGVEALMRWESPNGIISPIEFSPVLEETGVISEFTPFLFNQTLRDLREMHATGFPDLFMSVNVSAVQLKDTVILKTIGENLAKHAISPDLLECEVTESYSISETGPEIDIIKAIRDKGVKVSIDDFGSGHASFNYLKNFNSNKLKIDREFIRGLFDKPTNQTILRTIIELGHSLGLIVLAEGIETPEQEKWLIENGCDYGQGFLFSRPLPLSMLLAFLREQNKPSSDQNG